MNPESNVVHCLTTGITVYPGQMKSDKYMMAACGKWPWEFGPDESASDHDEVNCQACLDIPKRGFRSVRGAREYTWYTVGWGAVDDFSGDPDAPNGTYVEVMVTDVQTGRSRMGKGPCIEDALDNGIERLGS